MKCEKDDGVVMAMAMAMLRCGERGSPRAVP